MAGAMNIVAVVAQKGGTGKSTVAANLAVCAARAGLRTLAIDTDPQGSLIDWKRARGVAEPAVMAGKPSTIHPLRFSAERSGVELFFIDTRASALDNAVEAAKVAHLILVVVRPTMVDLRAIAPTVEALRPFGRPAAFVVNQAPIQRGGRGPVMEPEAARLLDSYGLPLAPVALCGRAAYQTAFARGRAPQELEPGGAAGAELDGLWRFVWARLQTSASEPAPRPAAIAPRRPVAHALAS